MFIYPLNVLLWISVSCLFLFLLTWSSSKQDLQIDRCFKCAILLHKQQHKSDFIFVWIHLTFSWLPAVQSWKSVDLSIARSVMKILNFAFMNIFPEFTMHKPENLHTCIAQVFKKSLCINLYRTYYADIYTVRVRKI